MYMYTCSHYLLVIHRLLYVLIKLCISGERTFTNQYVIFIINIIVIIIIVVVVICIYYL